MKKLILLLNELESKIEFRDLQNELVSKSTVAWQIDHTLRALNLILETVKNSNPQDYKTKFNFIKNVVFILGFIPRGKAKAPKRAQSFDEITLESLKLELKKAKSSVSILNQINKNCHFPHPYFGVLNLKETERFLIIHTQHHIKIINDIVQKKS